MGNSATKERGDSPRNGGESSSHLGGYSSRSARSRHNLESSIFSSLGGSSSNRETRERDREAERAAKEARRKQREEERQRERERSRREESLDGGFLVTHGVYTGPEDFKDKVVRDLMIQRRLAPFFKGLRDHDDNWTDAQLYAAFHDLPIPGPDAEPPKEDVPKITSKSPLGSSDNLTVPIASRSRSQSYTSETSNRSSSSFGFARSRAKTLSISSPKSPVFPSVAGPAEINDPSRFVDGRPIEAVLYKNATECPICFLYYPPYLNRTRCCDQDICSECFVQIKRADPHIPENHDTSPSPQQSDQQLVSEPASCPFCKQPDFGVTYTPPPFRRGLQYANQASSSSPPLELEHSPRRREILPLHHPTVVTSDDIRPDWALKLQTARAHAARRAAAATALHAAAWGRGRFTRRAETPMEERLQGLGLISGGNRAQDLEEMMVLEAIRLSLREEEERKRREEEEARRKGKGKERERERSVGGTAAAGESSSAGVVRKAEGPEHVEDSSNGVGAGLR